MGGSNGPSRRRTRLKSRPTPTPRRERNLMQAHESQPKAGPSGRWYFVITILSVGLFAAVPFFHAASRLDKPHLRKVGAGVAAGALLGFALISVAPTDEVGDPSGWLSDVAVLIMLTVMLVATILLIGPRREVYRPSTSTPLTGNQSATANVEALRRKRSEARTLATKDPMMARELGIGRGSADRGYDDGGLLELNFATKEQLTAMCGLPLDVSQQVVEARADLGRFQTVDDAIVFGQISEEYAAGVRDRGIVVVNR